MLSRNTKVFAATLISIIIGAVILKTLGSHPPSAGAFSLSDYYRLESVEKAVSSRVAQLPCRWNRIEIYYNSPKGCTINQLPWPGDMNSLEDIDCHFVIFNRPAGSDGRIQSTEKWQRQLPITHSQAWDGDKHTIRICVITDSKINRLTDFQIKRTEMLADTLSRKFDIKPESIYYPDNW